MGCCRGRAMRKCHTAAKIGCEYRLASQKATTYKRRCSHTRALRDAACCAARVAQLVEHAIENRSVASSILAPGTSANFELHQYVTCSRARVRGRVGRIAGPRRGGSRTG
jgi:hypothetical protein